MILGHDKLKESPQRKSSMITRHFVLLSICAFFTLFAIVSISPKMTVVVQTLSKYKTYVVYFDEQRSIKEILKGSIEDYENIGKEAEDQLACRMPEMLVDDPSIAHLLEHHDGLVCNPEKNWVYTEDGKFYIDAEAEEKYGPISCDYYHIKRISENYEEEIKYENYKNGSSVLGDGFRVECESKRNGSDDTYRNVHFTVPELKSSTDPTETAKSPLSQMHIFMFILDSVSRINFLRKLPKFYKLLTSEMDALVMDSYNIVGDGTPWAIIPLTTGHFQYELPEGRKRFDNASYLDDWPFIFKQFRDKGYGTVYAEEMPFYNAYTYKLKGFNETPVNHYIRPILTIADKERKHQKPFCLGDTPKSLVWLKYWRELHDMYEKHQRRTMSILFAAETSHDDYNLVQTIDEHLTVAFRKLQDDGYLNNTFLFVMSDHGRRFGPIRQSQSGKLEEKLPFLSLIPPPRFKHDFPESYVNLMANRDKLVTVFDLHATLGEFLHLKQDGGVGNLSQRGLSLFKEIPKQRTCQDAGIKPHFCACLVWSHVKTPSRDNVVHKAVESVVEEINRWLSASNGSCSELSIKSIISANTFKPNDNLLAFRESADFDNYSPDLSADKKATAILYQIRFTTSPGDADWEVTVNHFVDMKKFVFVEDNLSRLNKYGDQPKCIINKIPHLRSYCVCQI